MSRTQTTNTIAVREIARRYRVNLRSGYIYNQDGQIIGSNTYEPRISIRIQTPDGEKKKYGVRVSKVLGFTKYGIAALKQNAEIRHRDGNKFNNAGSNLMLIQRHRGSLNASQIRRIRRLTESGSLTLTEIAGRTGASRHQVSRIASGEAYTSVA